MENHLHLEQTVRIQAHIVKIKGSKAFVRAQNGCGRCFEKGGCGGAKLTQMFCLKPQTFALENTIGAALGDVVEVEVLKKHLQSFATLGYVLPLFAFVLGAFLGDFLNGEKLAIVLSFAFLIATFLLLKYFTKTIKNSVRLVRRL